MRLYDIAHSVSFGWGGEWYDVHPKLFSETADLNHPQRLAEYKRRGYIFQPQPSPSQVLTVVDPARPELVPAIL